MALVAGVRELRTLPKADLHLHLRAVCRDPRDLENLVRTTVADAAADGVVWLQPHFEPHAYPRIGAPEEILELVLAAGDDEGGRRGAAFGLTLSAQRHEGPERAEELARFAARYAGRGVCAFGLVGDEARYPATPFARAFEIARDSGLTAAPHAGEFSGPESVWFSVIELGATRIAHGVRAIEDPALLELLVERGVSLDVCLSSNRALGIYPDLAKHPLPALLAAGVRCSLGADDPLRFGTTLHGEYQIARNKLRLPDTQLAAIARTSVETGDAPDWLKANVAAAIEAWLTGRWDSGG